MRISDWSSDVCSSDLAISPCFVLANESCTGQSRPRCGGSRKSGDKPLSLNALPLRRRRLSWEPARIETGSRAAHAERGSVAGSHGRSAERRVGKEGVSTGSARGAPDYSKKKNL